MGITERLKENEEKLSSVRMDIAMKQEEIRQLNEQMTGLLTKNEELQKEKEEEDMRQRYVGQALEKIKELQKQIAVLSKYGSVKSWREGDMYSEGDAVYFDGKVYKALEDSIAGESPVDDPHFKA